MATSSPFAFNKILPVVLAVALVVLLATRSNAGREGFQAGPPDMYGVLVTTTAAIIDNGFLNVPPETGRFAVGIDQKIALLPGNLSIAVAKGGIFQKISDAKGVTGRYILIDPAIGSTLSYDTTLAAYAPLLPAAGISGTPTPVLMRSPAAYTANFILKDGSTVASITAASIPDSEKISITGASVKGTLANVVKLFTMLKDVSFDTAMLSSITTSTGITLYTKAGGYATGIEANLASYGDTLYTIVFDKPILVDTYDIFMKYVTLSLMFSPTTGPPTNTPIDTGVQFVDFIGKAPSPAAATTAATTASTTASTTAATTGPKIDTTDNTGMYIGIGFSVVVVVGLAAWGYMSYTKRASSPTPYRALGGRRR